MKFGMTRWKMDPKYPSPSGRDAKVAKFSTVLGVTCPKSPMLITPAALPPIDTSIFTKSVIEKKF